ncbi:hypothetical protein [Actinoplanes sp. NPDC051851]|uniref:hypothetical protein n=1 Tax=Actinoplanes sp. NPDC051851 TaxID=3154753 RepID=UPI00344A1977
MPIARRTAATAAALVAAVITAPAPAIAGGTVCSTGRFTATSQADLAKVTVLDPGPLLKGLPSLADVRLAPSHSDVDSAARPYRSTSTASYADARLLGMRLPGLPLRDAVANHRAPGKVAGPVAVETAAINAGGLATAEIGKSTAQSFWDDRYGCGRKTGPLTRSATMLGGLALLGGAGSSPAIQAVDSGTLISRKTSLLKVGPTGSTQSATDLVTLGGGRIGVRSGAGISLGDLTLFGGTPQQISVKVISQPTLEVVAGGDRRHSRVAYQAAVLEITSADGEVTTLDESRAAVSLSLLGRMSAAGSGSLLGVRLSLGEPTQDCGDDQVRAEAASIRVEVTLGDAHLLDVALGYLSATATAPRRVSSETPRREVAPVPDEVDAALPVSPAEETATPTPAVVEEIGSPSASPSTDSGTATRTAEPTAEAGGALALTGANVAAVGAGGVALIAGGLAVLFLTRRRRGSE